MILLGYHWWQHWFDIYGDGWRRRKSLQLAPIQSDLCQQATGRGQGGHSSRLPEGRKQRAGESRVELLQEGRGGGGGYRGFMGCPDPNWAVRARAPEGKALRGFWCHNSKEHLCFFFVKTSESIRARICFLEKVISDLVINHYALLQSMRFSVFQYYLCFNYSLCWRSNWPF